MGCAFTQDLSRLSYSTIICCPCQNQDGHIFINSDINVTVSYINHMRLHNVDSPAYLPRQWLPHVCDTHGCKQGLILLDGNCKLRVAKCAVKHCINPPIRGNQKKTGLEYCETHRHLSPVNLAALNNLMASEHPWAQSTSNSNGVVPPCNEELHYTRTGGVLFACRPCGRIVSFQIMWGGEGPVQVTHFMHRLLYEVGRGKHIKYIGYDNACTVTHLLGTWMTNGWQSRDQAERLFAQKCAALLYGPRWFVDAFHLKKGHHHGNPMIPNCCKPVENNPLQIQYWSS